MQLFLTTTTLFALVAPLALVSGQCIPTELDFSTLTAGDYVTHHLKKDFGITVSASATQGGYTPNGAARVFDTSNPGTEEDGDPDLGAPNALCPGGGPGVGVGGGPDAAYPNCEPLGNVLIVQEEDKPTPDDNVDGGVITFTFATPSKVDVLKLLDVDEKRVVRVTVTDQDGKVKKILSPTSIGDNSLFPLEINSEKVVSMSVAFPKSGAIAAMTYDYCPPTSGAGGDPHIKKWDGSRYYYHGECDLVLMQNERYGAGQGFDIHMRTKIKDFYSYIESVAMRIGNSILEVSKDKIMVNGELYNEESLPKTMPEGFTIGSPISGGPESTTKYLTVNLKDGDYVKFTMYKHFMNVDVSGLHEDFEHSTGLLGSYHESKLVGRNGETVFEDTDAFGLEWQVQGDDRRLFQDSRAPIYPQQCKMPSQSVPIAASRLLRGGNGDLAKAAEAACAHKSTTDFSFCVMDILATGDVNMAGAW